MGKTDGGSLLEERVKKLEATVTKLEEENRNLKSRLEEEEGARRQVEEKLRAVVEVEEKERGEIKTELEREKEERKRWQEERMKEVEESRKKDKEVEERNQEEKKKELKGLEREIKEVVERMVTTTTTTTTPSREEEKETVGDDDEAGSPYKCIVITDSNGLGTTEETIKNHMPTEKRARYQIQVVIAFRLEDAYDRIEEGRIDVENAYVIIDNITNNVRGGKNHEAEPPDLVTDRVAALRELILEKSAKAVVVCQLKPMKRVNVRAHTMQIHRYLLACGKGGYGCWTQIRMRYLKEDGFHVQSRHIAIVDKTYACALLGVFVPDPTPFGDLAPDITRRRWENRWPRVGGRGSPKS